MRNLGKWISIIARNSQIYYKRSFEKLGISGGQYIFLICICENEGRTQEWLAEELSMNKSTVARVVAALEQIGMVERQGSEKDKRVHYLYPTARAKKAYPEILSVLESWNENLTQGLSEEELSCVDQILKKVTANALTYAKCEVKEDE